MASENLQVDWTEVDADGHLTLATTKVTFATLDRDDDAYVYKDYGAGYFSGDFEHDLKFIVTSVQNASAFVFPWSMGNKVDDYHNMSLGGYTRLGVCIYGTAANAFKFSCMYDEEWGWSSKTNYAPGTYYLTIRRVEAVGTYGTLYLDIYSDATRETLLETVSKTLAAKTDFQYLYAVNSYNSGHTGYDVAGSVDEFDLSPGTGVVWIPKVIMVM